EVLIVRALGSAVRHDERRLPAAARAAGPLGVIRGRRRDVAQVDGVERGDVDAQLRRGRADERGQEARALADGARAFHRVHECFSLPLVEPEPHLADLTYPGIDLGRVLARLQLEEGVAGQGEQLREATIELREIWVRVLVRLAGEEADSQAVELVADLAE